MTPVLDAVDKPTAAMNILQRSVCMVLHCSYLGNTRKVNLNSLDVTKDGEKLDAELDEMGATKRLFASADLTRCNKAIDATKMKLRSLSVDGATKMFGDGAYLIPLLSVQKAKEVVKDGIAQLEELKLDLANKLPALLVTRAAKLGPMFNIAEYPTRADILASYKMSFSWVSFGAPDQLAEVDEATAEQAKADWNEKLSTAYDDVVLGLREGAMLALGELVKRLRPDADGKLKAIHPAALKNLQDLLGRLPILNSVGQDGDLVASLAGVGALAEGLDAETLKKAPAIRAMLLEKAEEAVVNLEGLVTKGRRAMSFGDGPLGAL